MDPLIIKESTDTPEIHLDKENNKFEIKGRSLCDDPANFYKSAVDWFRKYAEAPNAKTELLVKFDYLNIESSKSILDILQTIENVSNVKVVWCFNEEDEDMEEIGEEIAELVTIPFEFRHQ